MPQCFRRQMSTSQILVCSARLFIGMGAITCAFGRSKNALYAAPLTFRFDAQISSVSLGGPFNLPFEFQVGDTISGKFTFEPGAGVAINDMAVGSDQSLPVEFNINGTSVLTSGYRIVAFDDSVDYDSEHPPYDGLVLSCREASCAPEVVSLSGSEPFKVRWEMRLSGSASVWSKPAIVSDVDVWNAFSDDRRIFIGFDNLGPGSIGLDAVVNSMVQVPEPGLVSHLLLAAICSSFYSRAGRWRRSQIHL
jgi:hypothetical protein